MVAVPVLSFPIYNNNYIDIKTLNLKKAENCSSWLQESAISTTRNSRLLII